MDKISTRHAPGKIRDTIIHVLSSSHRALSAKEIEERVSSLIGNVPSSSIRSYLRLNVSRLFSREGRGLYRLGSTQSSQLPIFAGKVRPVQIGRASMYNADCFDWLKSVEDNSIHAIVTDPPYGLHEYTPEQQEKLRSGKGGVWRIPPAFDGHIRSPLPRFTTLTSEQLDELRMFFFDWGRLLFPKLVPGAHVIVACNPLLSPLVSRSLSDAGLERRGEIIRLTMTMRGGDRPKAAHDEFSSVSVMPRSMWEPWVVYRKPCEGRVQDNLRKWKTGGFRRPSEEKPFGDVILSSPTRKSERILAPHPSLKPQAFLRQIVRAVLPLGEGVVVDPFAGSGSTIAACESVGYRSIGVERDSEYFGLACEAIPKLAAYGEEDLFRGDRSSWPEA